MYKLEMGDTKAFQEGSFLWVSFQREAEMTHALRWPPFNRDAPLKYILMAYFMVQHAPQYLINWALKPSS